MTVHDDSRSCDINSPSTGSAGASYTVRYFCGRYKAKKGRQDLHDIRVSGLGNDFSDLGIRVQGSGMTFWGLGFRV